MILTTPYTRNPSFSHPKHLRLWPEFINKIDLEPERQQNSYFQLLPPHLRKKLLPRARKGCPWGTHLTRESSKSRCCSMSSWICSPSSWICSLSSWICFKIVPRGPKMVPRGPKMSLELSQKVIQRNQTNDTHVIWHGGGSGSACDSGYIYIYIYIYFFYVLCIRALQCLDSRTSHKLFVF